MKVSWQPDAVRTPIEHVVEYLLTGVLARNAPPHTRALAEQVLNCNLKDTRVVVLGGGTGLSTIVGGNSQKPDWSNRPLRGMKQEFPHLNSIVCTTDDGGSTGLLLRSLPIIGIGDLRKTLISSILPENLQRKYGLSERETRSLIKAVHTLLNHRFSGDTTGFEWLENPLRVIPRHLQHRIPESLAASFRNLGGYISPGNSGPSILPAGHSMGNLLLASAILKEARGKTDRPPQLHEIQRGIDHIADLIGAPVGRIHAATATPGQLRFHYANGVSVCGQSKSAYARRDSAVAYVTAEFISQPIVSYAVKHAIANADLIVYAPGSLYTSIIPILQLEPTVTAIRSNRRALKILGANSWIQEGETDISLKNRSRGFLVSELIEAYDRNISHGIKGLVDIVLSANLEHIPGNILRNYALEGKSPIHLDRSAVEIMGVHPIEATLFSPERQRKTQVIHHDPGRFALAIRTLLYADKYLKREKEFKLRSSTSSHKPAAGKKKCRSRYQTIGGAPLCTYLESIKAALKDKSFQPPDLKDFFVELAWENRDIHPSHLQFFRGIKIIPATEWKRSTEWDNILGFFDPQDCYLKLHEELLSHPQKLREDMLVALGESLLGQYVDHRRWIRQHGARRYKILLKPEEQRKCFLTADQLHTYLKLARMAPDPVDHRIYSITINNDGGFLPPGLLFGLLYSWYLCGKGLTMEYEMSLFRWPLKNLIPLHAKDRIRKEALVRFFRTEVFGRPE